jgi:hypothetical protein
MCSCIQKFQNLAMRVVVSDFSANIEEEIRHSKKHAPVMAYIWKNSKERNHVPLFVYLEVTET